MPSGVVTVTSSSAISTLACVPRLASLISPRSFAMRRPCRFLDPLGALLELLGLDRQQVAAGVDADIVELGRLPAQLLRHLHVALEFRAPADASISSSASRAARIGQRERPATCSGRRNSVRLVTASRKARSWLATTTGTSRGSALSQLSSWTDLRQVEMVGRLVEQQRVRLGHPDAGDQRQPLPAAAERPDRALAHRFGRLERSSATSTRHASVSRCRPAGRRRTASWKRQRSSRAAGTSCSTWPTRRPRERVMSPVVGSTAPARQRSSVVLPRPLPATRPRRSPVGDDEVEVGKERRTHGDAKVLEADQGHVRSLVCPAFSWRLARTPVSMHFDGVLDEQALSDTTKGRPKMERGFFLKSRDRSVSPASKLAGRGQGRADGGDRLYTRKPSFQDVRDNKGRSIHRSSAGWQANRQ